MNPVTPTSAMSRGGTFMRPGAMAWGHGAQDDPAVQDPATPAVVEDALATAVKGPERVTALLDELSRGRLWLPLPDASPVTDGSAVLLPTVTYLGAEFVPAFTSAERLAGWPGKMAVPAPSPGESERLSASSSAPSSTDRDRSSPSTSRSPARASRTRWTPGSRPTPSRSTSEARLPPAMPSPASQRGASASGLRSDGGATREDADSGRPGGERESRAP